MGDRTRKRWGVAAAALLMAGVSLVAAPPGAVGADEVSMVPRPALGFSGHAGLYGWGAATMRDGSVLVGDYWNMRVLRFAEDGTSMGTFIGNAGFGATQHQAPYGLAVDPDTGDVYLADTDRRQVDRYSERGVYLGSLGQNGVSGETPSTFRYPSRVAVSGGLVFVADTWAHRISVWRPGGTEQLFEYKGFGSQPGQLRQPRGLSFDSRGRLHVADSGNKRVDVFSVDAANRRLVFQRSYGSAFVAGSESTGAVIRGDMRGLAVDQRTDVVYVVDGEGNRVHAFSADGTYLRSWGGSSTFSDGGREVTVDHRGHVWVGDMPGFRVQVFAPDGTHLANYPQPPQPPPPGGFNGPRGVAVNPATGAVYVSDTYNFRLQKLAADGTPLAQWGTRGRSPYEFNYTRLLAVDPTDGSVVVADTDNHRIKKYDADGAFLWEVGAAGAGPLQFKNPHGIDIGPDGTIYVADTNNGRVQVLSQDGAFVRFVGSLGTGDGQFRRPRGVVADDATGEIYVSDAIRHIVQVFSPHGTYLRTIGAAGTSPQQMDAPFDVEVDDRYVYVADSPRNTVAVWRKDGTWVTELGGAGKAAGKLRQPQGLDLVGDTLYIAEQKNERISRWTLLRGAAVADTTEPTTVLRTPEKRQVLGSRPVLISGSVSDDTAVDTVQVAVQDRVSGRWWNFERGRWRARVFRTSATLDEPGGPTSQWSSSFSDARNRGSGKYSLSYRARDAAGNLEAASTARFRIR